MNIILIITIIIVIILVTNQPCWKEKETYVNMYGEYVDSPFYEDDDRKCRKLCNNISDCKGYSYDPTTDKCYLNSDDRNYLLPYRDHWLYPNYDPYLYKYGWWLQALYDNKINDGREIESDRESINTLRNLQNDRPILPKDFISRGYYQRMYNGQNAYHFNTPKNNNNVIKFTGSVITATGNHLGGGHGGRVRGNNVSGNEIVYR